MNKPPVITIDGPAASGKTTIGKMLAERLGYLFFDTGVMYRAVTWAALDGELDIGDEMAVIRLAERIEIDIRPPSHTDGRDFDILADGRDITWQIRNRDVEENVSLVSSYLGVRTALTTQQRRIGLRGSVVMVGRDIGTVVMPDARLKIYLNASLEERARRRYLELQLRGEKVDLEAIKSAMSARDHFDSSRKHAPLRPAADAIVLETDGFNINQVLEEIMKIIKETQTDNGSH